MSDLDLTALAHWMCEAVPGFTNLLRLEKFTHGQSNPTYRVDGDAGAYVLRRKPFGKLLPSAHAIEREYHLLTALHPTGFPVPRPLALCEDVSVIGSAFYLMEMVEGRNCQDGTLPEVPTADRRAYYDEMIDTLAALHTVDYETVGLGDFGRPGNYIARQVERWTTQYRTAQTDDIPELERLIEWLPRTAPEQSRTSIIHGDYRIDNLIFTSTSPRVGAVLDWELATIGDPIADFAYFAMNWSMPRDGRSGLGGVDLAAGGLPTLDDAVTRYCAATGRDGLPDLHWYFAYNLFRLVGILQGIKKRVADGNASNERAAQMAEKVTPLARAAWEEARRAGARE
ncbi:phosphotransferase family protein [Sphingobium sp. SCG-1]|uniref:phosphotransferase family protein n=1 Tax=Sphingobium sp. SCG-1 TaxID=2072936 RepID=UPI000CD693F5|nr:phosphotransferase family protein [Sphingobium sp. SCG-1]AUW56990.1 phosphotransferase family protein [Sphingobium sp. SCG-1]